LLTAQHRRRHGLGPQAYGQVVIHQRARAATHSNGLYTKSLAMAEYLDAPMVTSELRLYDCVPLVSGASAVVLSGRTDVPAPAPAVDLLGYGARFNLDNQEGDGLRLGYAEIAEGIWAESATVADEVDIVCLYDDYPVVVLRQLQELGYLADDDLDRFAREGYPPGGPVVNPSGGLLCCGQAGAGGTLHGLIDAVEQLRGRASGGQVPNARRALVTNYGMVLYRYGACAIGLLLGLPR
jgi:acetyl-CoA acetyltransferase